MQRRELLRLLPALPILASARMGQGADNGMSPVRIVGPGPLPSERSLRPSDLAQTAFHGVGPVLSSAFYEGLTAFDSRGRVVPALASTWGPHTSDAVWAFRLRDEVDAPAVARYLTWLCSPDGPMGDSAWSVETTGVVDRWHLRGDRFLFVFLKFPLPQFPRLLATDAYRIPGPVAKVYGPYALGADSPEGPRWRVELKPRVGQPVLRAAGSRPLVVLTEPDPDVRAAMVAAGDADVALSVEGARPDSLSSGAAVRYRVDGERYRRDVLTGREALGTDKPAELTDRVSSPSPRGRRAQTG